MIESRARGGRGARGADARALAASLVWTAERSFHVAVGGDHPTLVDAEAVVAPLTQLFVGTIYGRAVDALPAMGSVAAAHTTLIAAVDVRCGLRARLAVRRCRR